MILTFWGEKKRQEEKEPEYTEEEWAEWLQAPVLITTKVYVYFVMLCSFVFSGYTSVDEFQLATFLYHRRMASEAWQKVKALLWSNMIFFRSGLWDGAMCLDHASVLRYCNAVYLQYI